MRSVRQQLQCQPLGGVLSRKTMLEREHTSGIVDFVSAMSVVLAALALPVMLVVRIAVVV